MPYRYRALMQLDAANAPLIYAAIFAKCSDDGQSDLQHI